MKNIIIIFLLICIVSSCDSKKIPIGNKKQDEVQTIIGKVHIKDTNCMNQIELAKKDIKKNYVKYYYSSLRGENELIKILESYNIKAERYYSSSFDTTIEGEEWKKEDCYMQFMQKHLYNQFSKKFFIEVESRADSLYVLNHIDEVFAYYQCDTITRYPNTKSYAEQAINYKKDFFSSFEYPQGYKYKVEKDFSYSVADFILLKTGQVKDLQIETSFQNNENYKFKTLFENRIRDFIFSTKWIPAKSHGMTVSSQMRLTFHYR